MDDTALPTFWQAVRAAVAADELLKLTLSKPRRKAEGQARNLYVKPLALKSGKSLQITHRYRDREEAKNFSPAEGLAYLEQQLGDALLNGDLFTPYEHHAIALSRKGRARVTVKPSATKTRPTLSLSHDRKKHRDIVASRPYLHALGITNQDGVVLPGGKRKFRQINKFVEIIDGLVKEHPLPDGAHLVDMGSGSGYLTFALYDHLTHSLGLNVRVTGVELRPQLVKKCREIARENGFDRLGFEEGYIDTYRPERLDVLIALHACDTATDDALYQGLRAGAEIMVVAPCCQKQVRRDMTVPDDLRPLLNNGILLERQAAMLTDGIRALLLEASAYKTKLFEFIPLEHTAKNVMITALRARPRAQAREEIAKLKTTFGVGRHRLEELLSSQKDGLPVSGA